MDDKKGNIVVLGADHNGVKQKGMLKEYLKSSGYYCIDLGPYSERPSVDYVDYAYQLGSIIQAGEARWGVLICGTGVGMSIVANKFPNVRAALVHNLESAMKSREHNDANVLCLGAWINIVEQNLDILKSWINQKYGERRHVLRVEKIGMISEKKIVFANGVFDVLHAGHIQLLKFSKSLGDYLIVGLNSDNSVRQLKGADRPLNSEKDRKTVLESLKYVDEVIIFDELESTNLVNALNPNIVVKGGEWTADEVRFRDKIPDHIQVKVCPILTGYSSTRILTHLKEL